MLPRSRSKKANYDMLPNDEKMVRLLEKQNTMLLIIIVIFVIFTGTIILIGSAGLIGTWMIYHKVDIMDFNDAVVEVKHLTKAVREDYQSMRDALPTDLNRATRDALFDEGMTEDEQTERMAKMMNHWMNGLDGASNVLHRMMELDFVGYSTPLITRLAEASVTDQAAVAAGFFGEIVQYIGRHAKDKTLDQVFASTKDLMEMTQGFFADPKTQNMIKQMEESGAIERTSNATAAVMENLSSVRFDGATVGKAVEGIAKEVHGVIQKINNERSLDEFRDAFYSLAASTEVLVYDGINIGGNPRARSPALGRLAVEN